MERKLKDSFGREIDYLRISVTDRCNLRCAYCMPKEGVLSVSHSDILTYDEISRLAEIFAKNGIKNIKITGGEPLIRKGIINLIAKLKEIPGIETVTLTTNGVLLKKYLSDLKLAGIDGINISLDTLDRKKYEDITGFDEVENVLSAILLSAKLNIKTKVNVVTLNKYNKDDILKLALLAKQNPIDVRFIELMPMGLGKDYEGYSEKYIVDALDDMFGAGKLITEKNGNGPSFYYKYEGFCGKIGFISAISHKFCENCNRIRLTSEGFLKPCLEYSTGVDLREALRSGASDETIEKAIRDGINMKPRMHSFFNEEGKTYEDTNIDKRLMSKIGG